MATTYDNASLVMIPSGVKEDKLYSIKPTDGSGDFTFSRGSDIEATRVNSSGNIEKAKVNNLLQSNQFDTTWAVAFVNTNGGQSGYDGSTDAWEFEVTATGSARRVQQSISLNGILTYSVYAKAGTTNWVVLQLAAASNHIAYFDLQNGVVGTETNLIESNIESVGGGWYRCSITANTSSLTTAQIFITDGDGTSSVTAGANIYIQDSQINHGLIAQDYVETTTTAVVEGLTADLPRLDYSGGASCPSLLLEPSRTNLLRHSEYFGNYDTQLGATIMQNNTISPEGVQNASTFSIQPVQYIYTNTGANLVSGTTYTFSAYVRVTSGTKDFIMFTFSGSGNEFNSPTNTATTEWQRFDLTFTAVANAVTNLYPVGQDGFTGGDFEVYGIQFEEGTYPTSYIPTYGTAANRGEDNTLTTGLSSVLPQTAGTLFWDIDYTAGASSTFLLANSGTTDFTFLEILTNGQARGGIYQGGSLVHRFSLSGQTSGRYKMAFAYETNSFAFYVNGALVDSATSGSTASVDLERLSLDWNSTDFTRIHQALLFPTRLTNAELAALTTI